MEQIWALLSGRVVSVGRLRDLAQACEEAAPDTEQFDSLYTSAALDAASALVETLLCCDDGLAARGARVATSAIDTIDMYIQMRDHLAPLGEAMEELIARDPLMARELAKQAEDLAELASMKELTPDFINTLRMSSRYDILD